MFFYDPMYMLIMLIGLPIIFLPQMWLKNTFAKYDNEPNGRGLTGAQVAQDILRYNGLHDVKVEMTPGQLTDHYDPTSKTVRLSESNYYGRSIAGLAVAAHEVGHAIQHAKGYQAMVLRSAMAPAVNIGANLGPILLMIGIGLGVTGHIVPDWAYLLSWTGLLLYSLGFLFHLVTLPVEFDASARALAILSDGRFLTTTEMPGAKKVLRAAALTYVSVALYSLINVLYYAMRIMGMRRGD